MRIDEAKLRAYLDNELPETERGLIETRLADSPQLRDRLEHLRRQMTQTQRALQTLAPTGAAQSSARIAFKKMRANLNPLSTPTCSPDGAGEAAGQAIWEAPSLWTQLKSDIKRPHFYPNNLVEKITMKNAIALLGSIVVMALIAAVIFIANPKTDKGPSSSASTIQLSTDVTPVAVILNHEIELVGYHLSNKTAKAGDILTLTLYWQALRSPAGDYTVFVHMATADGSTIMSQIDRLPVQGRSLTKDWQPGQLVEDSYDLDIPHNFPGGTYTLLVGMYDSTTGARLPVYAADGTLSPAANILLAQFTIENERLAAALPPIDLSRLNYGIQADPSGDTAANIDHIETLGFEWVKLLMPWKEVEPNQGAYNWEGWDRVIETYATNGIRVMLTIAHAPDWARPADDDKSVEGLPVDPASYADFVTQVAERYQGQVQAIEVWNEQNLWYKVGGQGRIDAAQYVELLRQAYPAIKAANPEMLVISGGLSPAGDVGDMAVDDIDYLQQMYVNGAGDYFDLLGAQPSGYNCPALADWRAVEDDTAEFEGPFRNRHHSWCFLGTMEAYREVMLANSDEAKKIAVTQFGWAVTDEKLLGYEFAKDNTPAEQAQWIVEAYQWAAEQGWVGPMILFNLDLTFADDLAAFSILDTPAYEALVEMERAQ